MKFIKVLENILILSFFILALASCTKSGDVQLVEGGYVSEEGLLEGDPSSLASEAVTDYDNGDRVLDSEISVTSTGLRIVRTKFEIAFSDQATVGDVNTLLESIGATINIMLEGVNLIYVRIPDPGSLSALNSIIANVEADPNVLFVNKAYIPEPAMLPDNHSAHSSDISKIDHHLAVRTHAAWNAKAALESGNAPLLIVADHFGGGVPNGDFDVNSTASDYLSGSPGWHGYHVLGIVSARFGGQKTDRGYATGIYPDTLDVRAVDITKGMDSIIAQKELIKLLKESNRNMVVITSLGRKKEIEGTLRDTMENYARSWLKKVRGSTLYESGKTGAKSLENKFLHFTAAGNISTMSFSDASLASAWTAARLIPDLTTSKGVSLANLNNTLVIENRTFISQPFEPDCLHADSMYPGDLSAVGTYVWSLKHSGTDAVSASGTSQATPQAAGLAAYVWSLKPSLTPQELLALLVHTSNNKPSGCSVPAKPVIDAYSAVLAVDDDSLLPDSAPVRLAVLDIVGTDTWGDLDGDGSFNERDIERFIYEFEEAEGDIDYSRFDLNGDGRTGGTKTAKFDLDIDSPPKYDEKVTQDLGGITATFNENKLTDMQILCYYAYSDLFTGEEDKRNLLMQTRREQCCTFRIAFAGTEKINWTTDIFTMNEDGSDQTNISNWSGAFDNAWGLSWSPDGEKIAFSGPRWVYTYYYYDIFVMNADGTGIVNLTKTVGQDEAEPSWSPDGKKIVFTNFSDIYIMSSNGSGRQKLSHSDGFSEYTPEHPSWSPDGTKLVFADWKGGGTANIFVYDFTTEVTSDIHYGWSPAWSPDGNKIAFSGGINLHELYVMNADGSGATILYGFSEVYDNTIRSITWSPDGKKISFDVQNWNKDDVDIYVINADGTNFKNITNTTGVEERYPAWSP
jgi:Tol biopolymer transport system component